MSDRYTYNQLLKSSKTLFTTDELSQIWPGLSRATLLDKIKYLLRTKKLKRIKRGLYSLVDREIDVFELGIKLKTPSYVSFYTVLLEAGIVFQYYGDIYLASSNSVEIEANSQNYIFKKMKDEVLFNPKGIITRANYQIATPERAYLDTLYLNPGIGIDNESKLDAKFCLELAEIYQNNRLINEVKKRLKS